MGRYGGRLDKEGKNTEICDLGVGGWKNEQAGADGLMGLSIEFCV